MSDLWLTNPSERLASAYRGVHESRMQGLGFLNPALSVESVAFAPWEGRWLGVVVTPWSINLALTPQDPQAWRAVRRGDKVRYPFPAGEYEFIGATDDDVGELQICSLFSPVQQFEDQATARLVATLAREALFDAEHATTPDPTAGPALSPPGPVANLARNVDAPISRRDLFRGRFLGPSDDDRG
jgi:[NiFe] hydrogenase assembly HybE family chaperone